jgi:PAS domain S-box-containing protein
MVRFYPHNIQLLLHDRGFKFMTVVCSKAFTTPPRTMSNAERRGSLKSEIQSVTDPGFDKTIGSYISQIIAQLSAFRMDALIASSIDPIVQIDTLGTILLGNPACCTIFQYEEDELLGKNIAILMPEPYATEHAKYMNFYMDTGKKKIMAKKRRGRKLLGLRKDGTTFPMFLSLSEAQVRVDGENSVLFTADKCRIPGEKESGEFTTIFTGIMRDLSAEEEERQVMEAMINSSADPIVAIDIHGKVERANPACTTVFGYETEDMIGRNITMLMPEHHACKHHLYLERYLNLNPVEAARVSHVVGKGRDVVGKRKDGTSVPIFLSVSQFNLPSSKKRGFVGIMRDMTEKEKAITAEVERQKSEVLLMNVLPRAISDRLKGDKNHEHVQIADHYENVTILFADVVGFTKFAASRSPMEVVHHLNRVFRRFDFLVGKYGLEKVCEKS